MKKVLRNLGIALLILVIFISAIAIWQRNNIESLITSTIYTKEQLAEKIDDNKNEIRQIVESYTGGAIRDFNHEEEEQIRRGEITVEQAISKILKTSSAFENNILNNANAANGGKNDIQPDLTADANRSVNTIISEHIAQMYMLKAHYIGKLGDLERRAIADYKSIPKQNRGLSGKKSIVSKYLGEAAGLENECDAKVNQVLDSLYKDLNARNENSEVIKTIRKAYEDAKILKKSYYINLYK